VGGGALLSWPFPIFQKKMTDGLVGGAVFKFKAAPHLQHTAQEFKGDLFVCQCGADCDPRELKVQEDDVQRGYHNQVHQAYRKRCRRRTGIHLPYCCQHAKRIFGVSVARSGIRAAGNGLFAARSFGAGEWICPLGGEVLSSHRLTQRYGDYTAPYGVSTRANENADGALRRHEGHYANTHILPSGKSSLNQSLYNARMVERSSYPVYTKMWIKTTKNIPAGREIFISYGSQYELDQNVTHSTK